MNELIKISIIQDSADSVFPFPGYVDIGLIPEGARDIRIQEVAEAGNFLALRSDNPNQYFLNGGWTIQWNGDYKAAGTVFTYERTGHLENLTSPGPTTEPLWIQVRPGRREVFFFLKSMNSKHLCSLSLQLLFQEPNPGVRYEYTINRNAPDNNSLPTSSFFWKFGSWTECSVTCGAGRSIVLTLNLFLLIFDFRGRGYKEGLWSSVQKKKICSVFSCEINIQKLASMFEQMVIKLK